MKKIIRLSVFFFASLAVLMMACSEDSNKGRIQLYLADAPVDDANVDGVFLSITGVELRGANGWETVATYEEPVSINILDYQEGKSYFLTEEELTAGTYTEARLMLNASVENGAPNNNPGCYIRYKDGSSQELFVPSGAQSGYKVKGDFTLAPEGTVAVTLDFDVRKSIVSAGASQRYLLKPVVRLIANQNAAIIEGTYEGVEAGSRLVVYAYEKGTYVATEAEADAETGLRFANAVTSTSLDANGNFTLAFLNAGEYDLVFVSIDEEGEFQDVVGSYGTTLSGGARLQLTISTSLLTLL